MPLLILAIFPILAIIRVRKKLEGSGFSPFFMILNSPSNHHNFKINQVYRLFWVKGWRRWRFRGCSLRIKGCSLRLKGCSLRLKECSLRLRGGGRGGGI